MEHADTCRHADGQVQQGQPAERAARPAVPADPARHRAAHGPHAADCQHAAQVGLAGERGVRIAITLGRPQCGFASLLAMYDGNAHSDGVDDQTAERNPLQTQVAINWCIANRTVPIPGAKNLGQAEDNLGALGWRLSDGEVRALSDAADGCDGRMIQNIFQTK